MSIYRSLKVNKLTLKNAMGAVCWLKCRYKMAENGETKDVGDSGSYPVGQSRTLDLTSLNIPENAWVTVYAGVSAGKANTGEVWFIYSKDYNATANFTITGTTLNNKISYGGISDMYGEEFVNSIKLNNQSGTVCALNCFYKINKEDEPTRIGGTGYINVGQSTTLDLDTLEIPNLAWITAYVDVSAGKDGYSNVWFKFQKGNKKQASYTISGVINFTDVVFDKVENIK